MTILHVHGEMEYAASVFADEHDPVKFYQRMCKAGKTMVEAYRGCYVEIRTFPFTEVSEEFKKFLTDDVLGDLAQENNFFIVED